MRVVLALQEWLGPQGDDPKNLRDPALKARNVPRVRATKLSGWPGARSRATGAPSAHSLGQGGRARRCRAPNPLSERAGRRPESGAHGGFALRIGPTAVAPAAGSPPWSSTGRERVPTHQEAERPPSAPCGGTEPNEGQIHNEGNLFAVLPRQDRHQCSRGGRESLRPRAIQL